MQQQRASPTQPTASLWPRPPLLLLLLLGGIRETSSQLLKGLPKIHPDKIVDSLVKVDPKKVADAVKDGVDTMKGITPEKVGKALEQAGNIKDDAKANTSQVTDTLQAIGDTIHQTATTLNSTGLHSIGDTLSNVRSDHITHAIKHIEKAIPKDVAEKVVDTVRNTDPEKAEKVLDVASTKITQVMHHVDPRKVEHTFNADQFIKALKAIETASWWTSHWPWVLLVVLLLSTTIALLYYIFRIAIPKGARTPNLLVDSEINMYVRPRGGRSVQAQSEGAHFSQF